MLAIEVRRGDSLVPNLRLIAPDGTVYDTGAAGDGGVYAVVVPGLPKTFFTVHGPERGSWVVMDLTPGASDSLMAYVTPLVGSAFRFDATAMDSTIHVRWNPGVAGDAQVEFWLADTAMRRIAGLGTASDAAGTADFALPTLAICRFVVCAERFGGSTLERALSDSSLPNPRCLAKPSVVSAEFDGGARTVRVSWTPSTDARRAGVFVQIDDTLLVVSPDSNAVGLTAEHAPILASVAWFDTAGDAGCWITSGIGLRSGVASNGALAPGSALLAVSPNPSVGMPAIWLRAGSAGVYRIAILDALGVTRAVIADQTVAQNGVLRLAAAGSRVLPTGSYFAVADGPGGRVIEPFVILR
jgi:hypothetical protein